MAAPIWEAIIELRVSGPVDANGVSAVLGSDDVLPLVLLLDVCSEARQALGVQDLSPGSIQLVVDSLIFQWLWDREHPTR
jgi:hypothetical protein